MTRLPRQDRLDHRGDRACGIGYLVRVFHQGGPSSGRFPDLRDELSNSSAFVVITPIYIGGGHDYKTRSFTCTLEESRFIQAVNGDRPAARIDLERVANRSRRSMHWMFPRFSHARPVPALPWVGASSGSINTSTVANYIYTRSVRTAWRMRTAMDHTTEAGMGPALYGG